MFTIWFRFESVYWFQQRKSLLFNNSFLIWAVQILTSGLVHHGAAQDARGPQMITAIITA
jgi:hypothetical protein